MPTSHTVPQMVRHTILHSSSVSSHSYSLSFPTPFHVFPYTVHTEFLKILHTVYIYFLTVPHNSSHPPQNSPGALYSFHLRSSHSSSHSSPHNFFLSRFHKVHIQFLTILQFLTQVHTVSHSSYRSSQFPTVHTVPYTVLHTHFSHRSYTISHTLSYRFLQSFLHFSTQIPDLVCYTVLHAFPQKVSHSSSHSFSHWLCGKCVCVIVPGTVWRTALRLCGELCK